MSALETTLGLRGASTWIKQAKRIRSVGQALEVKSPTLKPATNPLSFEVPKARFLISDVLSPKVNSQLSDNPDDTRALSKALAIIVASVEDGTLSETEGGAVISCLSRGFAARQMDKVLDQLSLSTSRSRSSAAHVFLSIGSKRGD